MAARRPFLRRGPSGPLADHLGLIQVGYDQPVDLMDIPPASFAKFPRNLAGDPVKVILPNVIPGNALEVDWRANLVSQEGGAYAVTFGFAMVALVSFDGSEPTSPSLTSFFIVDSWGISAFDNTNAEDSQSISGLAAVLIPDGAVTATVELLYISTGDVIVATEEASLTLKVSEIGIESVSQIGPGSLAPAT
jgi:hypothetical protein